MINSEDAEEFTQSLGQIFGGGWRQIAWAERQGIPEALGLSTEEWVTQRLGGYVRLAVSERREAARELADEGMSQREIAAALGVDQKTVHRDLKHGEAFASPGTPEHANPQVTAPVPEPREANASPDPEPSWQEEREQERDAIHALVEGEPEPFQEFEDEVAPEPEPAPAPAHVGRNSGDNEWYTPAEYIKAATAVMGGIDLDPASSETANGIVGAAHFYTEDDDGLSQSWAGRVWMNPPYAQPWVDRFCTRVAREYAAGAITEACVLVNNGTETNWFQEVAAQATAICFPRGRVKFWHPSKEATPLQGQAVLYLGANAAGFRSEFLRFGFVVVR